jgi:hypothetical protein
MDRKAMLTIPRFGLFLLYFTTVFAPAGPIDTLFKYRQHIAQLGDSCGYWSEERWWGCRGNIPYAPFIAALDNGISEWRKNERTLANAFMGLAGSYHKLPKIRGMLLNDTILVWCTIEMLKNGMSIDSGIPKTAFNIFELGVPYKYMVAYGDEIRQAAYKSGLDWDLNDVLALTNPGGPERDSLLADANLRRSLRARLGDTAAFSAIINEYKNTDNYFTQKDLIKELGLCGNYSARKFLVSIFNDPVYLKSKRGCIGSTHRCDILRALQRSHADEPLLNEEMYYMCARIMGSQHRFAPSTVGPYLERLNEWFKGEYGIDKKDPFDTPVMISGDCKPEPPKK